MFFEINKIKSRNFFALCDAVADLSLANRKTLAEYTSLSYPTISRTVEVLLDLGILKEKYDGKSYSYSFNDKYFIALSDLRGSFRTVFTTLGGKELFSFDFKESNAFFFDEKLSLFLRNTAILQDRRLAKNVSAGSVLVLPSITEPYRDTRGILNSRERLESLAASYFPQQKILLTSSMDAVTELCGQKKAIIISSEGPGVILKTVGYGCDRISHLRSLRSTSFANCRSTEELAGEVAYAVGNLCDVLCPDEIVIDGSRPFGVLSFPRHFKRALSLFNCTSEDTLPTVRHYRGDACIMGAVKLMRDSFIDELIKQNNGEN